MPVKKKAAKKAKAGKKKVLPKRSKPVPFNPAGQ